MADDYMDDAAPSEAQSAATDTRDTKSDETEDQLALVPTSFFQNKGQIKPGMREMVEVVQVYENEVSIKCVYGDDEEKEEKSEGEEPPPEDEMMS